MAFQKLSRSIRLLIFWLVHFRTPSELLARIFGPACKIISGNELAFKYKSIFGKKGFSIFIPADSHIFRRFVKYGSWELEASHFLAQGIEEDGTIVDLGAHAGLVSLQALKIAKRKHVKVVAVEPIPQTIECLKKNFKGVDLVLFEAGFSLGNSSDLMIILDLDNLGNSTILPHMMLNTQGVLNRLKISSVSVADVIIQIPNKPFVLKSDLQGLDAYVLSLFPDYIWSTVSRAVIEVNPRAQVPQKIIMDLLENIGNYLDASWQVFPFKPESTSNISKFWSSDSLEERNLYLKPKLTTCTTHEKF